MINIHNKMTTLADNTRILSGTSDKLKLDDINTNLDEIVKETDVQYELLQDIKNALANKGGNGGSGGESGGKVPLVTKTGTTTSTTIDTGLSEIVAIMLKAKSQTVTGIYTASYMAYQDILQYTGASVLSSSKILTTTTINSANLSRYISINGGVLTWKSTGSTGFCSGVNYEWYAIGYE